MPQLLQYAVYCVLHINGSVNPLMKWKGLNVKPEHLIYSCAFGNATLAANIEKGPMTRTCGEVKCVSPLHFAFGDVKAAKAGKRDRKAEKRALKEAKADKLVTAAEATEGFSDSNMDLFSQTSFKRVKLESQEDIADFE